MPNKRLANVDSYLSLLGVHQKVLARLSTHSNNTVNTVKMITVTICKSRVHSTMNEIRVTYSPPWNADVLELASSWLSKFSKVK